MRLIRNKRDQKRRGTAAVEAAFCLPVIITVIVGSIEASNAIYLKQTATIAAYEAVKIASGQEGTTANGRSSCQCSFNRKKYFSGATVSVSPSVDSEYRTRNFDYRCCHDPHCQQPRRNYQIFHK